MFKILIFTNYMHLHLLFCKANAHFTIVTEYILLYFFINSVACYLFKHKYNNYFSNNKNKVVYFFISTIRKQALQ